MPRFVLDQEPTLNDVLEAAQPSQPRFIMDTPQTSPPSTPRGDMLQPFKDTFAGGIDAAKNVGRMLTFQPTQDYTPDLNALRDAANQVPEGAGFINRAKSAYANISGPQMVGAVNEALMTSPPGQMLSAFGGTVGNIPTTLIGMANKSAEEKLGVPHQYSQAAEMLLPFGAKKLATPLKAVTDPIMRSRFMQDQGSGPPPGGTGIGDILSYPLTHPLKTTGAAINMATKPIMAAIRPVARSIIDADNPVTGELGLRNALKSDTSLEGQRLENKLGVNFTAGELTGNATAMGFEDALANSARWGGRFAEENQKKVGTIVNKFNDTLNKIYSESLSREDVGGRISSAYNNTINSLMNARREQGKIDFKTAYEKSGEDGKYILSNNLFRTLQELAQEGDARLLTASKAEGGALARQLLSRLTTKTKKGNIQADTITLEEMGNGLSDFSAAARKQGGILDDAKTAAQRRIYARLYDALQKDLDAEIDSPRGEPERAAQLVIARNNYRDYGNKISDLEKTTLGKLIGTSDATSDGGLTITPESIVNRFTSMKPSELRNTLKFLDENHREVAQASRRYFLENALNKAQQGRGLRGEGTTKEFAKAEFIKNLPDRDTLNSLLKDPTAHADIVDIASAMNRIIDYGAQRKGSQTAQRTDFFQTMANWGRGAFYRSLVSDSLATDLLNPLKRKEIVKEIRENEGAQ